MENYEPLSFIGKGNFGSITKIKRKVDGKILVWKEFNYGTMREKDRNRIVQEVNILHELHHPNIVKYYDRIIDKQNTKLYIVMEYCPGGDLSQLIKRNRKTNQYFSEDIIWKIFSQVSSALYACHTHKDGIILHRDIKPSNIFIDQENNIKLGDFGLSRILNKDINFAVSRVGTPYYMSPEQIENIKYNEKSDIWSLGCFLYELVTLHPPFEANTHLNLARKIKSGKIDPIPDFYSNKLNEIINLLMNIDPEKRPNIRQIINMPEINIRIKEKKIKENLKKLKKMESLLKLREMNNKEKEEELMMKEKYLNEREKNINQREEYIKHKEEEFIKINENKFSGNNLSITSGYFNFKNLKIASGNSFILSNSFSYKNIMIPKEQKNNNLNYMNRTDNHFFKKQEIINLNNKQKEYYTALNTNNNNQNDLTQNASYNNINIRNDSTKNTSYNINNRNESTQNLSNNINSIASEINSNYIIYKPNKEEKNKNEYIGTSPNSKAIACNFNSAENQTRNYNNNKNSIDNYQNNFSYDNEFKKNQYNIFNQRDFNEGNNNYTKKVHNRDYISKKFSKNSNNIRIKHKKNEKYSNEEKAQSYNQKNKENRYNSHIINFNNDKYYKNNKSNINADENYNEYLSERYYEINNYNNNNININKDLLYKINSTPKPYQQNKINYSKPAPDFYSGKNKKKRLGENIFYVPENEKYNYEEEIKNNINQKHNSFNEANVKKNYYRKSNHYNSKRPVNIIYKKGSNNMNIINF